ncbi:MFS transporter [Pyramidobacter piscolens]|uniref:Transporter, major facilitator family protein n=1 Tax=Pyramidobacter piscolens W5455 TaxID=352165 RepID=A0ABP2HT47_9BACT|nr:MFS transporter [Pyramidobacter piscolens]EFB90321.1 transporter, major facilitator family protein [Pyramidobacter piscolens W5455]BDF77532.1 MFS transporter [Pyramidobacter piscolens]
MNERVNENKDLKRAALSFIVLMGVVSLFSDMTHEGGKSILGAYLSLTGASAAAVGFVSGFGELIGYSLRCATGRLADRTKRYWLLTILGYAVDLLAVPALALVPENGWLWAAALIVVERAGKAVKKPAKDTLLSFAAAQNGVGRSFALQELLDQLGAFLGPVALFAVMYFKGSGDSFADYRRCFALLAAPALVTLGLLLAARCLFPRPEKFEPDTKKAAVGNFAFGKKFTLYIAGISLFALGFMDFAMISMHVSRRGLMSPGGLPLLYAAAMGVDAGAALVFGWLYDRWGMKALALSALLTAPFSALIFLLPGGGALYAGAALWGVGMGAQESILKAAVATLVPKERRSSGYGSFQTAFGVCLFAGGWLMGCLYDRSPAGMALFSMSAELGAAALFWRTSRPERGGEGKNAA